MSRAPTARKTNARGEAKPEAIESGTWVGTLVESLPEVDEEPRVVEPGIVRDNVRLEIKRYSLVMVLLLARVLLTVVMVVFVGALVVVSRGVVVVYTVVELRTVEVLVDAGAPVVVVSSSEPVTSKKGL